MDVDQHSPFEDTSHTLHIHADPDLISDDSPTSSDLGNHGLTDLNTDLNFTDGDTIDQGFLSIEDIQQELEEILGSEDQAELWRLRMCINMCIKYKKNVVNLKKLVLQEIVSSQKKIATIFVRFNSKLQAI